MLLRFTPIKFCWIVALFITVGSQNITFILAQENSWSLKGKLPKKRILLFFSS